MNTELPDPTPMIKTVPFLGLDVHRESIADSIAPADSTEVRRYGIIGGSFDAKGRRRKRSPRCRAESGNR